MIPGFRPGASRRFPPTARPRLLSALALVAALVAPGAAPADDTAASSDEGTTVPLYLIGPERFQTSARAALLRLADLNDDGRKDFVSFDTATGLLLVHYSEEDTTRKTDEFRLENDGEWVWREHKLVLSIKVTSIGIGDFNGDGKTDLALASQTGDGQLLLQEDGRLREQPEKLSEPAKRLAVGDFNGDGRDDLLLAADSRLIVLLQKAKGMEVAHRLASSVDPQDQLLLQDMDGDGRADLTFADPSDRKTVLLRAGLEDGSFGPETRHELIDHFELVGLGHERIAMLDPGTRAITVAGLQPPVRAASSSRLDFSDVRMLPLPPEAIGSRLSLATLPSPGGGANREALVTYSKGAKMLRFVRHGVGRFGFEEIPSLNGVTGQSIVGDQLLLMSKDEKILAGVGIGSLDDLHTFPTPLGFGEVPMAAAAGALDAARPDALWVAFKPKEDEDENIVVSVHRVAEGLEEYARVELDDTDEREPRSLTVADLDNDGRGDFIIFFEYEDPLVYLQKDGGSFELLATTHGLLRGFLVKLKASDLIVGDYDGDGQNEILVARGDYLRAYLLDAGGELTIERQFNPPASGTKLMSPALVDVDNDGAVEVLAVQDDGKKLFAFPLDEGRAPLTMEIPKIDLQAIATGDFTGDGRADLMLLGAKELALLQGGGTSSRLIALSRTLADVDDGLFGVIASGGLLGAEAEHALIAVEGRENMMEFFRIGEDGTLTSNFRFKVFSRNISLDEQRLRRMGTEPREIRTADVDNDGQMDVVALAHKNVLVYRQVAERPGAAE